MGLFSRKKQQGQILGSIFIHKFSPSPIAVIGPLTVHPSVEGCGIGRLLMDAALIKAHELNLDRIRLVQSPSHILSFVLYTKCGFILREPLFLMQRSGKIEGSTTIIPIRAESIIIRPVKYQNDISECNELCKKAHGFTREMELRQAKSQGIATLERDDIISGFAASIGIFGRAIAKSNEDLIALIANASNSIIGPCLFVPARNYELIKWLLENSFKIGWPANLMTIGSCREPLMPFLPSLAY